MVLTVPLASWERTGIGPVAAAPAEVAGLASAPAA